ncbi:hypothetical protein BaRGS_00021458 [Batillaria attramentaria]|uniref:ShKT domain-containing protein n=1 Tax=Batillaria attramentaria TaxID=370345 RepID=A0ABD0KJ62_9CAEN
MDCATHQQNTHEGHVSHDHQDGLEVTDWKHVKLSLSVKKMQHILGELIKPKQTSKTFSESCRFRRESVVQQGQLIPNLFQLCQIHTSHSTIDPTMSCVDHCFNHAGNSPDTLYNLLKALRPSPSAQPQPTSSHHPTSTPAFTQSPVSVSANTVPGIVHLLNICNIFALSFDVFIAARSSSDANQDSCIDSYLGDCAVDFAGQCSDLVVHSVCRKTCGACESCTDKYSGDCSADFPGMCSDPVIERVCQKTCGTCVNCEDKYYGDCSVDFAGMCSDPTVQIVCQKTCGICARQSSCVDRYHGDCSVDFAGQCGSTVVQGICPKTCGTCVTTIDNVEVAIVVDEVAIVADEVAVVIAVVVAVDINEVAVRVDEVAVMGDEVAASVDEGRRGRREGRRGRRECRRGHINFVVDEVGVRVDEVAVRVDEVDGGSCYSCSGLDCIVNPTVEECRHGFCLTNVTDTDHGRQIARRCATRQECADIVLNAVCHDPDHALFGTLRGVTCQFCCNEPNCNSPPDIRPVAGLTTLHLVG